VAGIALVDRHEHQIVKDALGGKVHVENLGQRLSNHRQEDPFARQPEVVVLHRRHADDGREIGRALAAREAREMEHRVVVGLRVQPGVIAERPFASALARLHVAFEHDVRARRHLEIDGDALDQLDAPPREESTEQQLVESLGHRRRSRSTAAPVPR
jgi:hypothetical protein